MGKFDQQMAYEKQVGFVLQVLSTEKKSEEAEKAPKVRKTLGRLLETLFYLNTFRPNHV